MLVLKSAIQRPSVTALTQRVLRCVVLTCAALFLLPPQAVLAGSSSGFVVKSASTELSDNVFYLHADIDYKFSESVIDALHNGVPMVVVLDLELFQRRPWWWDNKVASLEQRYQLQYHALSEQYLVTNLNSGKEYTSFTLHSALYGLRDVDKLPVIDRQLLKRDSEYYVRIRSRLSTNNLPVPLRMKAMVSPSWWLSSDWYQWGLTYQPVVVGGAKP